MGVEVRVEGLTKSFGRQVIWEDVSLTLPPGEISVLLGPSGTGKSVFLKHLIGLLRPDRGHVYVDDRDVPNLSERELYETRKLFGVLFQDGALFGSMNIYDNTAFPLREHTKKSESEIKRIVEEKLELVGLGGADKKLPGEISGGMRKRAGLARALVLDPEILLFDEPDSGLDPVRTAYLNQLIVDLNAEIEATMLIVTHDINTARTMPDNIGLLYRRHLAMFGPREMLLSSNEPVVRQFLNAQRQGPIGMAEEKDAAELAAEEESGQELPPLPPIPPQITPLNGKGRRTMRAPGKWLKDNKVTPPPGSYVGDGSVEDFQYAATATTAPSMGGMGRKRKDDGEAGWDSADEIDPGFEGATAGDAGLDVLDQDDEEPTQTRRRTATRKAPAKKPAKKATKSSGGTTAGKTTSRRTSTGNGRRSANGDGQRGRNQ